MVFILMEDIYMAELCFVRTFFGRVSIMDSVHNMFYIWLCSTLVGSFWIPYLTQHKTIFLNQFTPPLIKPRISQNEIYYSRCCNSPQAAWIPWELNLTC